MKRVSKSAVIVVAIGLFGASTAQTPSHAKNPASRKHTITLETILSCADDSLIRDVFKTDWATAIGELSPISPSKVDVLAKGFEAVNLSLQEGMLDILPIDPVSGRPVASASLPFCHDLPTAHYENADRKSLPVNIQVGGENWSLNANEVFAHANQFTFSSGTFENSADVYLTATKGRVSIQFLCKPSGLEFYRAIYVAAD